MHWPGQHRSNNSLSNYPDEHNSYEYNVEIDAKTAELLNDVQSHLTHFVDCPTHLAQYVQRLTQQSHISHSGISVPRVL